MSNIFDRMSQPDSESPDPVAPAISGTSFDNPDYSPSTDLIDDEQVGGLSSSADANTTRTGQDIRTAVQELLKVGYFEEGHRREVFRTIIVQTDAINRVLEPLDFELKVDTHRGIAFLCILQDTEQTNTANDAWALPLVRKQRLTLEQSLLIAILRQTFIRHEQEAGVGQNDARTSVEELLPHYLSYFGDTGSDAKNESKLLHLLDQLKSYGIVTEVDAKQELVIRPLIAHLANPESLATLLKVLQEKRLESIASDANQEGEVN